MMYKALVKGNEGLQIIESDYPTKNDFIKDLRANGYKVNPIKVKKSNIFDYIMNETNGHEWDWKENN